MRLFFALALVCALSSTSAARRRCHGDCAPLGFQLEADFGTAQLSLAHERFVNTFTPLDSLHNPLPPETVRVTGRNIGATRPFVFVGELHWAYMLLPHLVIGPRFAFFGGDVGKTVETAGGAEVSGQGASGVMFGPELRAAFSRGPLEVRGGLSAGWRNIDLPIVNRWVHCKGGICNAVVETNDLFVEPRVSVALNLRVVSLGAYVGGDVMPSGGWTAGGFAAIRLGDWDKLADLRTWSRRGLYH